MLNARVPSFEDPQKTAPPQMLRLPRIFLFFNTTREPQWLPSERLHLLSLHKTRSEPPGAAPPQNFPIFKHYAPPRNTVTPQFLCAIQKVLRRQTNHSAKFDAQNHLRRFIKYSQILRYFLKKICLNSGVLNSVVLKFSSA